MVKQNVTRLIIKVHDIIMNIQPLSFMSPPSPLFLLKSLYFKYSKLNMNSIRNAIPNRIRIVAIVNSSILPLLLFALLLNMPIPVSRLLKTKTAIYEFSPKDGGPTI